MSSEATAAAVEAAAASGKATRAQIEDLLSGERARVRAVVEVLPEADLVWALGTDVGEVALRNAFDLMPDYYLAGRFDREVVVRFTVARDPGAPVVQDVTFGPDTCRLVDPGVTPDLSVNLAGLGFVRIATGLVKGMELLMRGELKVSGDAQVAMKMEAFFGLAPAGQR